MKSTLWGAILGYCVAQAALANTLLLVARPGVQDSNFARTVVLVTRTPQNEMIGLVLNRPLPVDGGRLNLPDGARVTEVYAGGPVGSSMLMAIGQGFSPGVGSIEVMPGVQLVVGATRVRTFAQATTTSRVKVFTGYAGWVPGQLESEIASGAWLPMPWSEDWVFDAKPDTLWERAVARVRAVRPSERLLGADELHAVNRTDIYFPHFAALQNAQRNRDAGLPHRP